MDQYGFKVKAFSTKNFKRKRRQPTTRCLISNCRNSVVVGRLVCEKHGG